MFPAEDRGEIFGLRNMFVGLTGILGTMVAGRLLDRVSFPPHNFTLLFLTAAGFGGCGIWLMSKMREPLLERPGYIQQKTRLVSRIKSLLDDEELGGQSLDSFVQAHSFCGSDLGFSQLCGLFTM